MTASRRDRLGVRFDRDGMVKRFLASGRAGLSLAAGVALAGIGVLGSAYPYDGAHPPVAYIRWLIEKNLEPGAIVILHNGIADPRGSIAALPRILATGRERGLCFVSIGTLMAAARR